jgi:hypothetical protein
MTLVPGGAFIMGNLMMMASIQDAPTKTVTVSSIWMKRKLQIVSTVNL